MVWYIFRNAASIKLKIIRLKIEEIIGFDSRSRKLKQIKYMKRKKYRRKGKGVGGGI